MRLPKNPPACGSLRPIGPIAAEMVADLAFRRRGKHLHGLGDRAMTEFLAELGAECGIQTVIDRKLATYAELDPKTLEAAGDFQFWPAPLHEVKP